MKNTLAVNCSILLNDRPVPDRLRAVADAGFRAVEFWWPFPTATPSEAEVDAFAEVAVRLGETLGTRRFNALYGNRIDGVDPAAAGACRAFWSYEPGAVVCVTIR